MTRPTVDHIVPLTLAVAVLAICGSVHAVPLVIPAFVVSNALNTEPSTLAAPADPRNSISYFQVYWDVNNEQRVEITNQPLIYTNSPGAWSVSTGDPTRYTRATNTADAMTWDATSVNQARSHDNLQAYANTGATARTWYVLSGGVGDVTLRVDVAFRGQIGAYGVDSVAHFTHQVGALSSPSDLTIERVLVINGTTDSACSGFGQLGTVANQCVAPDGSLHDINYVIRSNPFTVTFDVPFRLSLSAGTNAATSDGWATSDFSDPGLATLLDFPTIGQLNNEGFVLDLDGNWQTSTDVVAVSDSRYNYTLRVIPEPATLALLGLGLAGLGFARKNVRS